MARESDYYEIWFEEGAFIVPGPRFERLEDAVAHARSLSQHRPNVTVSISFPKVQSAIRPIPQCNEPAMLEYNHPRWEDSERTRVQEVRTEPPSPRQSGRFSTRRDTQEINRSELEEALRRLA